MKFRFLFLLLASFSLSAHAQNWSSFLDQSRAVDWSNAGFTIPAYSINCSVQPTLTANSSSAASANTTAIQNALNSCDATHNVVNIPAGTYYVAGINFGTQGFQVLRGAGASSTSLIFTASTSCAGLGHGVCMLAPNWTYSGDSRVQPGGSLACTWSAGYSHNTTSITLSNCGSAPAVGQQMILDQANDTSNTSGIYMCDGSTSNCTYEGVRNADGRVIGGNLYSEQQEVMITGVTGTGPYTVTISPGIYATNVRSSQSPGAWFPGTVQNLGIENMSMDASAIAGGAINMFSCYECWAKGVRILNGERSAALVYQSSHSAIRDSYFYGAQSYGATSYNIEYDESSDGLVENNIFQQVVTPINYNGSSVGNVFAYNYAVRDTFGSPGNYWAWPIFASHATGNNFNLFEGNIAPGIEADNASGPSDQWTVFRNLFHGYQPGFNNQAVPVQIAANSRDINVIGNVLGGPGYSTQYQQYPSSLSAMTAFSGPLIFQLGEGGTGGDCTLSVGQSTTCDPLSYSTLMRWGNYDTVTGGVKWDTTEASPAANTYVNANYSSSYFASLSHSLPASLHYSSTPSWWPSGTPWPPIGPDVSSGNLGICTGTFAGNQAASSNQCPGGTLSSAWAGHAHSIPAMDCYLNSMSGPPDGSGSALNFNANSCYSGSSVTSGSGPGSPSGLVATVD